MSRYSLAAVILVAVLISATVLYLASRPELQHARQHLVPAAQAPQPAAGPTEPEASRIDEREEVAVLPERTCRAFLAEFWGEQWESRRAAYEDLGVVLDGPLADSLLPWEEASPLLQREAESTYEQYIEDRRAEVVAWPEHRDLDQLRGWYSVALGGDVDAVAVLDRVNTIATEYNDQLGILADAKVAELDRAFYSKQRSGDFMRFPLAFDWGWCETGNSHSYHASAGGWHVLYVLDAEPGSALYEIQEQAHTILAARHKAIRQYLYGL